MNKKSLTFILLLWPLFAFAARPFVTDDARLTTAGSCQVESWVRTYSSGTEFWMLPACNPTGNFELTFGGGHASYKSENSADDYVLQAKSLIRPLTTNDWGWGVAFGVVHHPGINPGPNLLGNTYAYIPVSASFYDDRIVSHVNVGWLRDKASGLNSASWGVGGEFKVRSKVLGIVETYGDNRRNSFGQLGARYSVIPDLLQVDATIGRQLSGVGGSRWISFGVRFTPDRIF